MSHRVRAGFPSFPSPDASPNMALQLASKFAPVPQVLVRRHRRALAWRDWFYRELKDGGHLQTYLARERARTAERYRRVARATRQFKQNARSDLRVLAQVPARDFLRWRKTDPDFWSDNANLRSLRRDNPDVKVYV